MFSEFFGGVFDRRSQGIGFAHALVIAIHMGRRDANHWEQQALVIAMKSLRVTQTHGADSVAMVGFRQRGDSYTLGGAFELPVLHRHLHGDLHRGGAAVGIKNPLQPLGRDLDQLLRQIDSRFMTQAEKGRVRQCDRSVA